MASPKPLFFKDPSSGEWRLFTPLQAGKITFYSCGPTVYDYIHIGNLRGALVADLLFRGLQYLGYEVCFVTNYTDVEDKILQRAQERGESPALLAARYQQEVERDYALAGILPATHAVRATDHIEEMQQLIQDLLKRDLAYVSSEGEVFFRVRHFPSYGNLSGRKLEDLQEGARVEVNPRKEHAADFILWKPALPGELSWESPWGPGRPGWHIECSAMARRWLGDQIDLHHGGEDLLFPHHENEVAQSEGASGKAPFVKHWVHHAFVTQGQEKMSKSVGNLWRARDFLEQYGGEVARYLLIGTHYRSPVECSLERIESALTALQRVYEFKADLEFFKTEGPRLFASRAASSLPELEAQWGEYLAFCQLTEQKIETALSHDFNTPEILGALFSLIREWNRREKKSPSVLLGVQESLRLLEETVGGILGIGRLSPASALRFLSERKSTRATSSGELPSSAWIEALLEERKKARSQKDFNKADQIRRELEQAGVVILDQPEGTTWRYA